LEQKSITLIATSDINYDQRLQKIAQSLSSFDYQVTLIGRQLSDSKPLNKTTFSQNRLSCFWQAGVLFYIEINIRLFFYLLKHPTDILVVNDVDTALAGILTSWFKKNLTLYFDAHEYYTEVPELQNKNQKKKIWAFLEKTIVQKSEKCYTVNQSLANIFKKKYGVNFEIVRNVPYLNKNEDVKNKENYILYQGALNKGRGLEVLISAMPQINTELKIAGKGDIEKELKDLVNQLGLTSKIHFLGNLQPHDLKKITAKAKIGVNLLESYSLNYYYSLANKFFDYMHADLPQICMHFPEYEKINNSHEIAVLIADLNPTVLSNEINKLLKDEDLYNRLTANCKAAKKIYNWESEQLRLKKIYQ